MKITLVLLLAGLCAISAFEKPYYKVADKEFLGKQKDILRLFNYVNQPSYYKDFVEIADSFKFEEYFEHFDKPEFVKDFWYHYEHHDFLPQGEVFSVFYPEHYKQAEHLFKVFYHAKDYETFYKFAVWARQHMNEGLFVYTFSVACVHGKFTEDIILPPIYEIYPHFFFNNEVIHKAQQYKQHYWKTYENEVEFSDPTYKGYTIHANYSGWYMNVHPEQSMTYFTEDIGINSYYYYQSIYAPFWLPETYFKYHDLTRGEYFYYYHQQLMARYYLERLSNGFGEIPHFDWEHPIETGYYPSMHYPNGLSFPSRPNHADFYYEMVHGEQSYPTYGNYSYSYTHVQDYERRIREALDSGFFYTPEGKMVSLFDKHGFETLGYLIESNVDSPNGRYYGDLLFFARRLLGYSHAPLDEFKLSPSALEHYETSLRDPMFWQLYKKIMHFFFQHQQYQGPYEHNELFFDGVKVEDFYVDRLITYFDHYYSDLSNAVYVDEKEFETESFEIRAHQYRLNHKAFTYKVQVASDKPVEAFVKVFIGPKYDEFGREIDMSKNYYNFYEIDRFHYTLAAGKNVIERKSQESPLFSFDRTTYKQLYQYVMSAYKGSDSFKYFTNDYKYYGMPQRFMLPKGDFGGKSFQFFVMVTPYHANEAHKVFVDTYYPMAYPFDRPIEYEHEFFVPNFYFKDVMVYHKNTEEEINTTFNKY